MSDASNPRRGRPPGSRNSVRELPDGPVDDLTGLTARQQKVLVFLREEIEKRIQLAVSAGEVIASVDPAGLSTVIVAMLRGVALQRVLDDKVDLAAARREVDQLLASRLGLGE